MVDTSKDGFLLGGGICHITLHHSSHAEVNKFLLAYCFNLLLFGNIKSACAKEYLIAAMY